MEKQTVPGQVSYLLNPMGRNYVLSLRPNRLLLPSRLRVFSFEEERDLLQDHPYLPRDCNYMGFVEGSQESEATLSTCLGGLRGILKMDDWVFQIEPIKDASSFEYIFYLLKDENFITNACGLTDEEIEQQITRRERPEVLEYTGRHSHRKCMELLLVFDPKRAQAPDVQAQ
ncbi:hypothetical protein J1605_022693 [Eschrichtius robustus]|uniref:Peptidase M12B propeptide domain-containing protein n=1 Tax=Eschrichtius robustus TaxID=9764 RepID=A0AB34HB03_ESCRO|nr:hypothetical protein J1605_022693 [Eschrichtius robustus]